MLIPIDHGNDSIKTINHTFASGIAIRSTRPPMGNSVVTYNGQFYALTEKRLKYMWDKTATDHYFALTLLAIAKEIQRKPFINPDRPIDIQLAVGLPPLHYGALFEKFEEYFMNREPIIHFGVDGKEYHIQITNAIAYSQAYAAAMTIYSELPTDDDVIVIDLGGRTTDYVHLRSRKLDLDSSDSIEFGMVDLYQRITSRFSGELGMRIQKNRVDRILKAAVSSHENPQTEDIIRKQGQQFIDELAAELRERGIDLRTIRAIFVGGGALALEQYITHCNLIPDSVIINDIRANAKGFGILYGMDN